MTTNMHQYHISSSYASNHFIEVTYRFKNDGKQELNFHLPAWRPGRYEMGNFVKNIQQINFYDSEGNRITANRMAKDHWQLLDVYASEIVVKYAYYCNKLDAGSCFVDKDFLYLNFGNCMIYEASAMYETCSVTINTHHEFPILCVTEVIDRTCYFNDFHHLVDSPLFAVRAYQEKSFLVGATKFNVVFFDNCTIEWDRVLTDFYKFTEHQIKVMKYFPVKEYSFFTIAMPDFFYHGVEHTSSTILALGPAEKLMEEKGYLNLLGVASHELYHVWNIKTLRPASMWPYRYQEENYCDLGYVYEGVTTYLGDLFLRQSSVISREQFFNEIGSRLNKHQHNPARLTMPVAEASIQTWIDGYVAGIPWRKTSIYDEGSLLALIIDLNIIIECNGAYSIHDFMRELYDVYLIEKRGYTLQDIKLVLERFLGKRGSDLIDQFAYSTRDMLEAISTLLPQLGVTVEMKKSNSVFEDKFGFTISYSKDGHKVGNVWPGSPAVKGGLAPGDEIYSLNGERYEFLDGSEIEVGSTIQLKVYNSREQPYEVTLHSDGQSYFNSYQLKNKTNKTPIEGALQRKWLG
jgi:predicted metalloprotease with PDZ domain